MAEPTENNFKGLGLDRRDPIQVLASQVVEILNARSLKNKPRLRGQALKQLVDCVVGSETCDTAAIIDQMHKLRLTDDDLLNLYIPEAARLLGRKWDQDEMNFAQVTIGCARLQSVLHSLSDGWVGATKHPAPDHLQYDLMFLLATYKGDEHTLGIVSTAAKLRRRGYAVQLLLGATHEEIVQHVQKQTPDCMMLSCSSTEHLEKLAILCQETRAKIERAPVVAVGGIVLEQGQDVELLTDVDLATQDLQAVLHLCLSRRIGKISVVPR